MLSPKLSPNLEKTLRRAFSIASALQQEYATLEHLLLALLDDPDARPLLVACGADIDHLRVALNEFLEHESSIPRIDGPVEAKPTAGFQRAVQRAAIHVQSSGRSEITGANVLVALFSERESHAAFFLAEEGLTRLAVVTKLFSKTSATKVNVDLGLMIDATERAIPSGVTFVAGTVGDQASLEETLDLLDVLRLDVSWGWRISETIARISSGAKRPYWIDQTIQDLKDLNKGKLDSGMRMNALEFDPLDEPLLPRPLTLFIQARKINPLEVTIAVTAASLTILIIASIWSLRAWKRSRSEEEFNKVKVELVRRIFSHCENAKQFKEIEGLLFGVLNSPGGLHKRGEEIVLSIPHLLKAKIKE